MWSPYFLWDSDSDSGRKEPGLRLQDVMCDILIVYFRMIGEKI